MVLPLEGTRQCGACSVLADMLLSTGLGCNSLRGGTVGTKRGVTTLSDAKMKVSFSFGYPRNGGTQLGGGAGIDLQFRDVGLLEGAACPIVIAKAYLGGVELAQYATGGAAQCGI